MMRTPEELAKMGIVVGRPIEEVLKEYKEKTAPAALTFTKETPAERKKRLGLDRAARSRRRAGPPLLKRSELPPCPICEARREKQRKWYRTHKEEWNAYMKRYRAARAEERRLVREAKEDENNPLHSPSVDPLQVQPEE